MNDRDTSDESINSNPNQIIRNGSCIWLDSYGILHTVIQEGMHVTLADANAHLQAGVELTNGAKHPVLVDVRKIKSMDRAARMHYAISGVERVELAVAILVGTPVAQVIGNFFMSINRAATPTSLFTDEEKALEWLRQYCE